MTTMPLRKFWTVLVLFGGMAASMFAAGQWAWRHSLHAESDSVQRQLALYGQTLAQRIDRYRTLPEVLALDAQLQYALARPLAARPSLTRGTKRTAPISSRAKPSGVRRMRTRTCSALSAPSGMTITPPGAS